MHQGNFVVGVQFKYMIIKHITLTGISKYYMISLTIILIGKISVTG